jgi:methionine biosynthesis protein MetW
MEGHNMATPVRPDHAAICELVEQGARVLDLGCGDGELLALLVERKGIKGEGVEVDEKEIYKCVARGLSVFHGNIESGLPDYPEGAFDFVILNKSLQEARNVDGVLKEALRVGHNVIVGFPNFAPMTNALPHWWQDTPNLRFWAVKDFEGYCRNQGIKVLDTRFIGKNGRVRLLPNLLALDAIFLLSR